MKMNTLEFVDLVTILKCTSEGNAILKKQHENTGLNDTTRTVLLQLIITYFRNNKNNNIYLCAKVAENLADQIITLFPSEMKVLQ